MRKMLAISEETHRLLQVLRVNSGKTMTELAERAVKEFTVNNPTLGHLTVEFTPLKEMAPEKIEKEEKVIPVESLPSEPVLPWEVTLAPHDKDIPTVISDVFTRERALMDTVALKLDDPRLDGYSFATDGDMATMVLSEFAGVDNEVHRISPEQRAALETIRDLPAVVQVRQDGESFIPVNDTAKAVLALGAGKRTFNKYNLFALHHVGFRIEYVK